MVHEAQERPTEEATKDPISDCGTAALGSESWEACGQEVLMDPGKPHGPESWEGGL